MTISVKIGLIGDPHADPVPVAEALALFRQEGVERVFCTGDIAGYGAKLAETVALLRDGRCQSVVGNHDVWHLDDEADSMDAATNDYLRSLPLYISQTIAGRSLYLVHASPPDHIRGAIRLLDQAGVLQQELIDLWREQLQGFAYDVLIVGHSHQVYAQWLDNTLLINPGSTSFNHCCAILSLPDCTVEFHSLSGESIQPTWNWSDMVGGSNYIDRS
jgi:putative phosphoesterase